MPAVKEAALRRGVSAAHVYGLYMARLKPAQQGRNMDPDRG